MDPVNLNQKDNLPRCSCCDSVNSLEIANNPENYRYKQTYYEDPQDSTRIVCSSCLDSGDVSVDDYEWNDEDIMMITNIVRIYE